MLRTRHPLPPRARSAAPVAALTLAGALLAGCGSNYQIDGHFVYSDQDENGNGVTIVITQAPASHDAHIQNAQHIQRLEVPLTEASEQARHALRQLQTRDKSNCTPKEAAGHAYTLEIHHPPSAHHAAPHAAYYLSANMACGHAAPTTLPAPHWDGYIATDELASLFQLLQTPAPAQAQ